MPRYTAVGRLLPSATSALRRILSGNAGRVLLPLLGRCVTVAQARALPIVRCEGGLVAGVLVRVLLVVVGHQSSSDLGNEGLSNLRDILAQRS